MLFDPHSTDWEPIIELPPAVELPPAEPVGQYSFAARPYQITAAENVFRAWQEVNSTAVAMATGTGKTRVAGFVAERVVREWNRDFLFIAHRDSLIEQGARSLSKAVPGVKVGIEQAGQVADRDCQIVVASKDSLYRQRRLNTYDPERFGAMCIDEGHHASHKNKSYRNIWEYFRCPRMLLSASFDRADGVAMNLSCESVAYVYDILDGINDGWLVPIRQVRVDVDELRLDLIKSERGDLSSNELAEEMLKKPVLYKTAQAAVTYSNFQNECAARRPTLVFAASGDHAREIADILNRWHRNKGTGEAAVITHRDTKRDEQREIIRRFNAGRIQYLVSLNMLTEGFDSSCVRVIVIARPTKARAVYAQIIGRGTRPDEEIVPLLNAAQSAFERKLIIRHSRKPATLVVDVVGVSGQHKLITPHDILGGKAQVGFERFVRKAKPGEVVTVDREVIAAQRAQELHERQRRKSVLVAGTVVSKKIDPFAALQIKPGWEPPHLIGKRPTPKMLDLLARHGFTRQELNGMSFYHAKQAIIKINQRRQQGLCTLRMGKVLARHGHSPDLPFEAARKILDAIAAQGWKQ